MKFNVPEEVKKKRRWVIGVLTLLLIVSIIMYSYGYPFNREVSIAFVISFAVAWILKVIDWIEHSELMK